MPQETERRRREATRAMVKYFLLIFLVVFAISGFAAYAVVDTRQEQRDAAAIRIEYCEELEKLKTQNREDVAEAKKNFKRNLRLLGIEDTPEIRRIAEDGWVKDLARNAPKSCPYTA